jgi:hypothetical protein
MLRNGNDRAQDNSGSLRGSYRRGEEAQARFGDQDADRLGETVMATMHWGRKETIIFPPHSAIYTYGAVFFAVILTALFVYLRFTFGNRADPRRW